MKAVVFRPASHPALVRLRWIGALIAAIAMVFPPATAFAASSVRLPGHVLAAVASADTVAPARDADASLLTLTIVLKRDDAAGFDREARAVYDPSSPSYRRFLTLDAMADRFGPSRGTYERLVAYFAARGFTVQQRAKNRLTLVVRGRRDAVERALDVRIADYRVGDRTFYANDRDPALPAALAGHVINITGLSNAAQVQPATKTLRFAWYATECALLLAPIRPPFGYKLCVKDGVNPYKACITKAREAADADADFNYDFLQFANLYDHSKIVRIIDECPADTQQQSLSLAAAKSPRALLPTARAVSGSGQKIGIISFDSFVRSDVADFLELVGIPAANLDKLSQVHVNGGAALGPNQDETLLDVTTVMTLAPSADVVVYDGPFTGAGSFQALFNAAVDDGATVISNSWAYCEDQTSQADVDGIDAIFATAAAAGISIVNGSGDTGSTCLDGSANTVAVPASAPHGTAVGGSSVVSGQGKSRLSETWWDGTNASPPTGQGGFGVSRFFTRPAFQDGDTVATMRSVPDVVSNADPAHGVMICQASAGGCPTGALYGGTSSSAPTWAAFAALINEALGHNVGSLNETLYPLAGTPAFNSAADLGSDFAHVGLGSPSVDHIVRLLKGQAMGTPDAAMSIVTPSIQTAYVNGLTVPVAVPADGVTKGYIAVKLLDANGHLVSGKTVTLAANGGTDVVIAPASGVTGNDGTVVFTVTDLTAEEVTFTATDTTDNVELTAKPVLPFVVPPAAGGGISASASPVTADGIAFSTITVTLQDALSRPTPGKEVTLAQAGGHALITGPSPGVTDGAGQIQFQVRNLRNETVVFTATDVSDGDLPVPGSAQVVFDNSTGTACGLPDPEAANGYLLTPFATGFMAQNFLYGNVNWGGCGGASIAAFVDDGLYVAGFVDGALYKLGFGGGAVSTANKLSTLGPTLGWPVIGKDGKLYALRGSTGASQSGVVVEIDPGTGNVLRTLASNLTCPNGLAVDPISGDLFFDDSCFGGGFEQPEIRRIRSPGGASPTVETFATLPSSVNGVLSFAPDGTLYASSGYNLATPLAVRVTGTNSPTPGTVTTIPGVNPLFWLTVGEALPNGDAKSLIVLQDGELRVVDITTNPVTSTALATNIGSGTVGPDGCLYLPLSGAIFRLTDASGGCNFAATTATPGITLTPARIIPDPARGTSHTLTATLRNVASPEGTAVFFQVTGANPRLQMVRADASGKATFTYVAAQVGADVIVASATPAGGTQLVSSRARITWTAGKQTTELTLTGSTLAALPGATVNVTAALTAIDDPAPVPAAGASVDFTLGGAQCSGTTDANGRASCQLTGPISVGFDVLQATFAGNDGLLGSTDTAGFVTTCPAGLDGVACHLTRFQSVLTAAPDADVKRAVRKSFTNKAKRLQKLVTKARTPGKKGAKATKQLGRKLDVLVRQLQKVKAKKMAATLRDALVPIVQNARATVP